MPTILGFNPEARSPGGIVIRIRSLTGILTAGILAATLVALIVSTPRGSSPTLAAAPTPEIADSSITVIYPAMNNTAKPTDPGVSITSQLGSGPLRTYSGKLVHANRRVGHLT